MKNKGHRHFSTFHHKNGGCSCDKPRILDPPGPHNDWGNQEQKLGMLAADVARRRGLRAAEEEVRRKNLEENNKLKIAVAHAQLAR